MRNTQSLSERTKRKHEAIEKEYHQLYAKGLRDDVIYPKLAEKFFMSVASIEALIWKRGGYYEKKKEPKTNQLNLFGDDKH